MNQIVFGDCRASMRQFIDEGRKYLGCELNEDYRALQDARIQSEVLNA